MDIDPRAFETPAQKLVREGYGDLALENQRVLQTFDPDMSDSVVKLQLTIDPVYEAAEPQLAAVSRKTMLQNLGLTFQPREEDDPNKPFEYAYPTGEAEQILYITRQDGRRVPVFLGIGLGRKGDQVVEEVVLIPSAQVGAAIRHREVERDTYLLDARLTEEFGLEKGMLELLNLSLDDKRAMLASFDKIQQLDIAMPDGAALAAMRRKLAKAMLPRNTPFAKGDTLESLKAAYEQQQVGAIIEQYGLDEQPGLEFAQSERLHRLQALNEQLRSRQRAKRLGLVALTGLTTLTSMAMGALAGIMVSGDENIKGPGPAIGAVVGATAGVGLGLETAHRMHKRDKRIRGFNDHEYYSSGSVVSSQLDQEAQLARSYNAILNH